MKKLIIIFLMLLGATSMAQSNSGFGITAGINYGSTGDIESNGNTIFDNQEKNIGYNVGVYYKFDIGPIYLRPELKYTHLSNEYENLKFDMDKIDLPILIGIDIIGPLHVFAGPSLQYIVDTDFEDITTSDVKDDFTIGAQVGVGVSLGNLGVDVRYERGLNENEVSFIDSFSALGQRFNLDTRPEQIILALSLKF